MNIATEEFDDTAALPGDDAAIPIRKARAKRGVIISNCQVQPLKHILSLFCDGIRFDELAVHLIPAAKRSEAVGEFVAKARDAYDVVLSIPLSEDFGPISSERLKDSFAGKVVGVIPNFYFAGLHPDSTYIGRLGGRYRGPIGDYHSKLAVYGYAAGLSVQECAALYCDEIYRRTGYYEQYAQSLGEMARREKQVDIRFAGELSSLLKEDLCFFTFNHPTSYLFWHYCRKLAAWLEGIGVTKTTNWPWSVSSFPNHLASDTNFPVYPEMSTELGLSFGGSYSFKPPAIGNNAVNCIDLEEFLGGEYEAFGKLARDEFVGLQGAKDALDELGPRLGLNAKTTPDAARERPANGSDGEFSKEEFGTLIRLSRRALRADLDTRRAVQRHGINIIPANFYSGVPTLDEIDASFEFQVPGGPYNSRSVFDPDRLTAFLGELDAYADEFDPPEHGDPDAPAGFFWRNRAFSFSDAMAYYCVLRHLKPKQVLEVGSGFSTFVALQALERNGAGHLTCIEPFPRDWLRQLEGRVTLHEQRVQHLEPRQLCESLADGDVLFIDSTHAVKAGSDCLHIYLRVLPELSSKIHVHAHDIFLPFPVPKNFSRDHVYWTEQYLLYAYLLHNAFCKVDYGSQYHFAFNRSQLDRFMRGRYGSGGGSIWFTVNGPKEG